jgi:signal transduction histidine kinase
MTRDAMMLAAEVGPAVAGGRGDRPVVGILAPLVAGAHMTRVIAGVASATEAAGARIIAIQTLDPALWGTEVMLPPPHPRVASDGAGWPRGAGAARPRFRLRAAWDWIDGFLVALDAVEPWYLDAIRSAGKPVVMISCHTRGFDCPMVHADNRSGVLQAVDHLVAHGHRRIAFAGSPAQADIAERLDAYREGLRAHGIAPDDRLFFPTADNLESSGEITGREMVAAGMPSTAIVAATDYNALGIMKALREAGLVLPRDQAIVGFDDVDAATAMRPTLSTVRQSLDVIGQSAATLLLDMVGGKHVAPGSHRVPTVFLPRESCGCTAATAIGGADGPVTALDGSARGRLRHRLERLLVGADAPTPAQVAVLDGAVELMLGAGEPQPPGDGPQADGYQRAALALYSLSPRWTTIMTTVTCLRQYWRERADEIGEAQAPDEARAERQVNDMIVELSRSLADEEADTRTRLQLAMDMEHDMSSSMIRGSMGDPRALGWLAFTQNRGACLGLWSADQQPDGGGGRLLDIAGSYLEEGGELRLPARTGVEAFPPLAFLEELGGRAGEMTVILPASTTTMDLGLLALVTPIEATQISGRDRLFDKGALLGVAIERDLVTERLRRSNADLATFSHAMAHDLRNPLATITMWASVARSQTPPSEETEPVLRIIDQIREVAGYSNDLITALPQYAELDRGDLSSEPVDLGRAASRAVATVGSAISEQGATVEVGALPTVRGRFAQLELVLQNLVENSIKYRGAPPPRIRIEAALDGGFWTLRCGDNGAGVPDAVRERVFDPFVRGHDSVPGSGLGLATCRRIVEGHGGRIWIEATGGTGTTVAFTLPAIAEPETGPPRGRPRRRAPDRAAVFPGGHEAAPGR